MEVKVLYFSVESNRYVIEREFNGKSFGSISEVKNLAEMLEVDFVKFTNIEDYMLSLNDEDYPTEYWVVNCYIEDSNLIL